MLTKEQQTIMGMPFIAVGNDELDGQPSVKAGDKIHHKGCLVAHKLQGGKAKNNTTGKWEKSDLLLFYKCKNEAYLAAIAGKLMRVEGLKVVAAGAGQRRNDDVDPSTIKRKRGRPPKRLLRLSD